MSQIIGLPADKLLKDYTIAEQMAYTYNSGYQAAIADVQKILDEISDDCCITIGHMTYGGGKDELKRRVSALLEDKS